MKCLFIMIAVLAFLQGCAVGVEIQEFTSIKQEVGAKFDVGVGGEIYTSKREKTYQTLLEELTFLAVKHRLE